MRLNISALPRAILQTLIHLHAILNAYWYFVAQLTAMQYIALLLNIGNRKITKRFKSVDIAIDNFARCWIHRRQLLVHACITGLPALYAWIALSSTSCRVTASSTGACGQLQTSVWKTGQWCEFGNKAIIFYHSSHGFRLGRFRYCKWQVTGMGFGFESTFCENRASVLEAFLVICHLQTCLTAFRQSCEQALTIYLALFFCFLNGVVTRNRALTKPAYGWITCFALMPLPSPKSVGMALR